MTRTTPPAADRPRLDALYEQMLGHLEGGIVPFWLERAADPQFGGFLTNFDEAGRDLGTDEKYLNTQCRLVWWFSRLLERYPAREDFAALARTGADFVIEKFWDTEHEGWFWKTRRDGSCLDDGKIVYGQSFAIYAMAQYALATGDPRGLDYASRTFDLLQTSCADTRYGGYYENLNRDWTPEAPGFAGGDRKGLDTHMHLMEAMTVLYRASGREVHRRKLAELIGLIMERMVDAETGSGLNQFDLAFRSIPAIAIKRTWNAERFGEQPADPTETTSYGHNVELVWLASLAIDTAGLSCSSRETTLRRLLDHACDHGVDWSGGGVFRDGLRATGEPIVREKEFWQNGEVLVGFLDGYERFGQPRYLDAVENVWGFVREHMIIADVGEWRTLLDEQGRPLDAKIGNPWKVAYHSGRSMIECVERLERLGESIRA